MDVCFAKNLVTHDKFVSRVVPAVLMGYSETQKGYKLYNIDTKSFFISRDVRFYEHVFTISKNNDDAFYERSISLNEQYVHDDAFYEAPQNHVCFIQTQIVDHPNIIDSE